MAKRKRLTPANPAFLDPAAPEVKNALGGPIAPPPIADVAREASASAVAEELAQELSEARESGRMVVSVPLHEVQLDYLVRDRVVVQDDEMQALKDSLRARGQQTPVELVALEGGSYGLISGWRRCHALQELLHETGETRFAQVLGLLRKPTEQAEAYVAMVEENEIRVGLSYFERARIVAKAVERGVFAHDREALQALFGAASRAKRSKIGSFLPVVRALEGALRFPEALTERQGLALSRAMTIDTDLARTLRNALEATPPASPEEEAARIEAQIAAPVEPPAPRNRAETETISGPSAPAVEKITGGITLTEEDGRLILTGPKVDPLLKRRLVNWLRQHF